MPVTLHEVRKIASLARLRPRPEEEDVVAERMAEIVRFAEGMSEPADGTAPEGLFGGEAGFEAAVREREDVPKDCLDRGLVLANAPEHEDGFVRLPPIGRSGGNGSAGGDPE